MRSLSRLPSLPAGFDVGPVLARVEPVVARLKPLVTHAAAALGRVTLFVAPYIARADGALRKYPKLAAAVDGVGAGWARLVDAFCATIDPVLSRYFPDLRLVAVVTSSGDIVLNRVAKGIAFTYGTLGAIEPVEQAALGSLRWSGIELRLPPEQMLRRTLSLPGGSRDFLGPIIEHRLDRLTPWRPDRVLYGYDVHDAQTPGALAITLVATSKDIVAAPLQALGAAGLVPTAIGAAEGGLDKPLPVNLLKGAAAAGRADSRKVVSRAALVAFALLGIFTIWTSSSASDAVDDQLTSARKLTKARRLLKNATMGNVGARERALLEAKQPDRAMVVMVDKLSAAIPEDTFLKEMSVAPDKVRLTGTSGNAPALVAKLEGMGLLNVRFSSAITRERDGRDSFEITADRAAPPAPDAP